MNIPQSELESQSEVKVFPLPVILLVNDNIIMFIEAIVASPPNKLPPPYAWNSVQRPFQISPLRLLIG